MVIIKNWDKEMCFIPTTERFKLVCKCNTDAENNDREFRLNYHDYYESILIWKFNPERLLEKTVESISFRFEDYLKNNSELKITLSINNIDLTDELISKLTKKFGDVQQIQDVLENGYNDEVVKWSDLVKSFEYDFIDSLTEEICYCLNHFKEVDKYCVVSKHKKNLLNKCFYEYIENYILNIEDFGK